MRLQIVSGPTVRREEFSGLTRSVKLADSSTQVVQNRFAEGIGEFLVARDGGREAIAGIEINIVFGPGSFERAAECLKRVNKGSAFHAVRAISLVLARRRAAGRGVL